MLWIIGLAALAAEVRVDAKEAARLAWESAAEREVALWEVRESEAGARARPDDPQLRVRAEDVGSKLDPMQWTLRLRQPLEPIGSLRAARNLGRAGTSVAQAELLEIQAEVVLDALECFDLLRLASADVALAKEELDLHDQRRILTEKRLEAGLPVQKDVIDAGVERMGAIRRVYEAEVGRTQATTRLVNRLQLSLQDSVTIEEVDLFAVALEEVESHGRAVAPGVSAAEIEEANLERKTAVAERRPFFSFAEAQLVLEPGKVARWGLGTSIQVPIFSLSDGEVAAADALIRRRQAELAEAADLEERARGEAYQALLISQEGLREILEAEVTARARMAELVDGVRPDQKLRLEADLLQERRRSLDLVSEVLEARRLLGLADTLGQLGDTSVKVEP